MRISVRGGVFDLAPEEVDDLREQLSVEAVTDGHRLLSTSEAAALLGKSEDFCRQHAAALGGRKLTDSPKARWVFDPATLISSGKSPEETDPVIRRIERRRAPRRAGSGQLLKARG
ncbi:MAG: hypothetical protein J0H06_09020 [Actinobacteria bacterium]|nr:hypothetical protein [Actinomycetota bacterium]